MCCQGLLMLVNIFASKYCNKGGGMAVQTDVVLSVTNNNLLELPVSTELDEIKDVLHILRHKCDGIYTAEEAVKLIVHETGISEERVREILTMIGKKAA